MEQSDLDKSVEALRDLLVQGCLDEDLYHKLLVQAAYDYAVAGFMDRAVELLREIPLDYYERVQPGQLESDLDYAKRALDLAQALLDAGIVSFGPNLNPTQGPASA